MAPPGACVICGKTFGTQAARAKQRRRYCRDCAAALDGMEYCLHCRQRVAAADYCRHSEMCRDCRRSARKQWAVARHLARQAARGLAPRQPCERCGNAPRQHTLRICSACGKALRKAGRRWCAAGRHDVSPADLLPRVGGRMMTCVQCDADAHHGGVLPSLAAHPRCRACGILIGPEYTYKQPVVIAGRMFCASCVRWRLRHDPVEEFYGNP